MDWWTCNNTSSLENVPVVSYLCGTPSSMKFFFKKTVPRKKKPNEIKDPSQCNALVLPDCFSEEKVRLLSAESVKI